MAVALHDSQDVTNNPGLTYPYAGMGNLQNVEWNFNATTFFIPMHLTSYTPAARKPKVNIITMMPNLDLESNLAYGGTTASEGAIEFAKLQMEGFIDTPMTQVGDKLLSAVSINGTRLYYADLIVMYMEGRASASTWQLVNPVSFRDPYGRVYNRPKVIDFTASYLEAVPTRTNFTMTLKVG